MQDRLEKRKERLDAAIEMLALLCEPVEPPKGELEHIHYFCGNTEIPTDLKEHEPQRVALYRATVVGLVRAYANIADELEPAGYSPDEVSPHQEETGRLPEIARDHPLGERRNPRPETLRSRHAPPDRHLHRSR
jgi:hypothetical protein